MITNAREQFENGKEFKHSPINETLGELQALKIETQIDLIKQQEKKEIKNDDPDKLITTIDNKQNHKEEVEEDALKQQAEQGKRESAENVIKYTKTLPKNPLSKIINRFSEKAA